MSMIKTPERLSYLKTPKNEEKEKYLEENYYELYDHGGRNQRTLQ